MVSSSTERAAYLFKFDSLLRLLAFIVPVVSMRIFVLLPTDPIEKLQIGRLRLAHAPTDALCHLTLHALPGRCLDILCLRLAHFLFPLALHLVDFALFLTFFWLPIAPYM